MPHCTTETPVSSSLDGCELAFRAIVAFKHALDPVARSHKHTHTHIRTLLRPPISRHAPFKTSNTLLTKVFERVSVYGPLRPLLGHSAKEIRSASHLFHRENYGFSVRTARSAIVSQKGHTRLSKKFARVSV